MMPNSESWKNLNACWVSGVIPEWWVMEEVCAENLLLLQIDVQGRLSHKTEVWSAFRKNKISRIQDFTSWRRRREIDQSIYLECCCCRRLAWGFLFLASCHFGVRHLAFSPSGHICQSWGTIADIWLIGWQCIVDRSPTPADCWRIPIIILQRVEVKGCKWKMLRYFGRWFDLYLILAWLVIVVQSHAI